MSSDEVPIPFEHPFAEDDLESLATLRSIMSALRDPDTGCPWDVEQDFASIAPYTIEEAYEVADAIERENLRDLKEELGDLLLQVIYHSQMAEEAGAFCLEDVLRGISTKMIRRHPHVFGDDETRSAGVAKGFWEKIKAAEKAARRSRVEERTSILDDVPLPLPALTRAEKLQKKAAKVGFDWPDIEGALSKVSEEHAELRDALSNGTRAEQEAELGDLLFAIVNVARHAGLDPEAALRQANSKFSNRFKYVERTLADQDQSVAEAGLEEMDRLWEEAKRSGL